MIDNETTAQGNEAVKVEETRLQSQDQPAVELFWTPKKKYNKGGKAYCAASFCWNTFAQRHLHKFPKDIARTQLWVSACNRPELFEKEQHMLNLRTFLCDDHFEERMFMNEKRRSLVWNAVPSLFIWEEDLRKKIHQVDKAMGRHRTKLSLSQEASREVQEWSKFMDTYYEHGIRSQHLARRLRKFVEDMGMKPKKKLETLVCVERIDTTVASRVGGKKRTLGEVADWGGNQSEAHIHTKRPKKGEQEVSYRVPVSNLLLS